MEPQFWHQRWQNNEIGFHQADANPFMVQHWSRLGLKPGSRVLVPLCGKSVDMLWLLEQGHRVTGVELSELALEAFVAENQLSMEENRHGPFRRWQLDELELLAGDFFEFKADTAAPFDAVYDRAALIALPEEMRAGYAARLAALLPSGTRMLLITLDYDQNLKAGPPFAVGGAEVQQLFADDFVVEELADQDVLEENLRFKQQGLDWLREHVYLLERR